MFMTLEIVAGDWILSSYLSNSEILFRGTSVTVVCRMVVVEVVAVVEPDGRTMVDF